MGGRLWLKLLFNYNSTICALGYHGVWIISPPLPKMAKEPLLQTWFLTFILSSLGNSIFCPMSCTQPCIGMLPPIPLASPCTVPDCAGMTPCRIGGLPRLYWKRSYSTGRVGLMGSSLRPLFPPFRSVSGPSPVYSRYFCWITLPCTARGNVFMCLYRQWCWKW